MEISLPGDQSGDLRERGEIREPRGGRGRGRGRGEREGEDSEDEEENFVSSESESLLFVMLIF